MSKVNVPIYDLNNSYFLYEDIDVILTNIGELYEINFKTKKYTYKSETKIPENAFWFSNEANETFNKLVPKFKSLIKDMYSIIEGIYVTKFGTFKKLEIEKEYVNLKELREINNKFKHHNIKNVEINFVSTVDIESKRIDCMIRFDYKNENKIIQLCDLIDVFFNILEDNQIITIEKI